VVNGHSFLVRTDMNMNPPNWEPLPPGTPEEDAFPYCYYDLERREFWRPLPQGFICPRSGLVTVDPSQQEFLEEQWRLEQLEAIRQDPAMQAIVEARKILGIADDSLYEGEDLIEEAVRLSTLALDVQKRQQEEQQRQEQEQQAREAAAPAEIVRLEAELAALQGQATPADGQRMPVYGLKELPPAAGGAKA
jgi:hypothetical protein